MRKIIVGGLAAATLGVATLSAGTALAHPGSSSNGLAGKLADKFSLNETEVQTFLSEQDQASEAEHTQARAESLQAKVDDGTITSEQKDSLIAKQEELQTAVEALRGQDSESDTSRDEIKKLREEFKTWADAEGIDLSAIRPEGKGGGHGRGMMNRHGRGMMNR